MPTPRNVKVEGAERRRHRLLRLGASGCLQAGPRSSAAVDGAEQAFGPAHLLVNNAGMIVFGSLLECQDEDWERMLSVDMYGVFVCTQVVGRRMIANGVKGTMVHIGSTASYKPAPQQFASVSPRRG